MQNITHDRLLKRELGGRTRYSSIKGLYSDWVKNLDIINELDGHTGCVNALSWSKSGTLLASGSDDTHINIHSYQSTSGPSPFKLVTTIATGHTQNIFSVKFGSQSNDRTVISAAGDSTVRVFDIEYSAGNASGSTSARGQGFASRGIQYLSEADTSCRVYRSHSDRVKRIVTESSPYLFLTCSEDGEVRQFDLRQPSSAYPRPAGGGRWRQRDEPTRQVPPALISYRGRIDLNTISCSASQPHYIALGGSHMHCFLHDRRMLGRDMLAERGGTPSSSGYSDHDELMDQATQCVKRFAPNGIESKKAATGHITACKISDANPNEMIASWSGDWIYSFDLHRSPDAREERKAEATSSSKSNKLQEARDRKRKRVVKAESPSARQSSERGSSRTRTLEADDTEDVSLRVRYHNGQSEDIPMRSDTQVPPIDEHAGTSSATASTPIDETDSIAMQSFRLRQTIFGLDESDADQYSHALRIADGLLDEIDRVNREWRYPVDPDDVELAYQKTLRANRESTRRFVQSSGTLARLLGGELPIDQISNLSKFAQIRPAPNELEVHEQRRHDLFCHEFLRAIILWLSSGPGALVEGFTQQGRRAVVNPRFPVQPGAGIDAIEEEIIPYLEDLVNSTRPIYNLEANRFEVDSRRLLFDDDMQALRRFTSAVQMPFEDLATHPNDNDLTSKDSRPQTHFRAEAVQFWGQVGLSLLYTASEAMSYENVDRAFGGSGSSSRWVRQQERALRKKFENISTEADAPLRHVTSDAGMSAHDQETGDDESEQEDMVPIDDLRDVVEQSWGVGGDTDDDDEEDYEMDDDEDDAMDDEDEDEELEGSEGEDEDSSTGSVTERLFHSAAERRTIREGIHANVPCVSHQSVFKGACNVKTVKDVNFFGLSDEFVVAGSDCGNLFLWDRSGKLVTILEGDGEVVNVVQGHPYEPVLAVSGIDNTIKVFSPDRVARRNARLGLGVAGVNPSGFSSLRMGRTRNVPAVPQPQQRAFDARDIDSDETDTEPPHAPHGLSSRKRMHLQYEITSRNDHDRKGGNREAFITRSMLAQLTQSIRGRRAGGTEGDEEVSIMVNGQMVNTGDCGIM